jgi:hypothetical protein
MTKPLADVYHLDCYGLRKDKYQTLLDNGIDTLPWQKLDCLAPEYFFVAKDFGVFGQYQQGFSVSDLFPVNSSGIKTHRDDFVIGIDKNTLSARIESFYTSSLTNKELINKFSINEKEDWIQEKRWGTFNKNRIKKIHYRPFDSRYIYYASDLIERGREKVMQHFLKGENVGLLAGRQAITDNWSHIQVTCTLIDNRIHYSNKGISVTFPLYLYPETTGQQSLHENNDRQPNLNPDILEQIAAKLGLTFVPEQPAQANNETFAPIDLLDYIYAVLHSPNYRETYKEFLKTDFPRVPYPNPETFWQLVKLGGELRQLHLLEHPTLNKPITTYPMAGDNSVTRKISKSDFTVRPELVEGQIDTIHGSTSSPRTGDVDSVAVRPELVEGQKDTAHGSTNSGRTDAGAYEAGITGRVWINDTQYFDDVPAIAWEFYIGGYQPAQKWLKDRHGRTLTFEDILHYQKIIVALTETHRIMQAIDVVL